MPRTSAAGPIAAFEAIGIELEYAIVARSSLDVLPIADRLLAQAAGNGACEVARGVYGWSNELVQHVIEVKNLTPAPNLAGVANGFATEVAAIDDLLASHDARLLPSAMHPWMNPVAETFLWPHANAELYRHFDRIFDCARHGWANLQSMHVNLPFAGDAQFARLHAAIRLVLPIIPALAASSPFADGDDTGRADYRLAAYRENAALLPAITGLVIPETASTRTAYEATVLAPMYRAIAPYDPAGLLQHEWLNSHGAIARFDRSAIEIRVTDCQECPRADVAIAAAVTALVRMLYSQDDRALVAQQAMTTTELAKLLASCIEHGEAAMVGGAPAAAYLALLGYPGSACSAGELWRHLIDRLPLEPGMDEAGMAPLHHILQHGTLATRLRNAVGDDLCRTRLQTVYGHLADCLRVGRMFDPSAVV